MADLNCWAITGRLAKDAEFKTLPSGKSVLECNVAVNTGFGAYKKTTWVKVQQWGDRGANIAPYLTKGSQITCSGELTINQWEGKQDAQLHTDLVLSVMSIQLLSSKPATSSEAVPVSEDDAVF